MRGSILRHLYERLNTKDTCMRAALQARGYIYLGLVLFVSVGSEALTWENKTTCLDICIVGSNSEDFLLY